MTIAIDLILAVILAATVVDGYRKGLIRSVLRLASVVLALILASVFSGPVGTWASDTFAHEAISDIISENISSALADDPRAGEMVFSAVDRYVFNADMSTEEYVEMIASGGEGAVERVSGELAGAISSPLCNSVAFFAIFILALIALRIVTFVADKIFSLPVLNEANRALGLIFGAVCGIILVMIISRVFICILPWLSETFADAFPAGFTDKTVVLNFFGKFNFFGWLLSGIADVMK